MPSLPGLVRAAALTPALISADGVSVSRWPLVTRARLEAGDDLMDPGAGGFRFERLASWILDPRARHAALEERKAELAADRRKQVKNGEEPSPYPTEPDDNFMWSVSLRRRVSDLSASSSRSSSRPFSRVCPCSTMSAESITRLRATSRLLARTCVICADELR